MKVLNLPALKITLLLCCFMSLLSIDGDLYGQCEELCNTEIEIINFDFEDFDMDCINNLDVWNQDDWWWIWDPLFWPTVFHCEDGWTNNGFAVNHLPDMLSPNYYPDYEAFVELSGYLTSQVAAFAYHLNGAWNEEIEMEGNILYPTAPNVSVNVTFDLAAAATDGLREKLVDIPNTGEFWVQTGSSVDHLEIIPFDNSYNVKNGFQTICTTLAGGPFLRFKALGSPLQDGGVAPIYYALLDNVLIDCKIVNANLNISNAKLGALEYDFDLKEDDPDLYTSNIASVDWDFGDENTSDKLNPQHTYDEPGVYTITAFIKDEFGCCTTLTKEIIATEGCGDVTLKGTNQLMDLISELGLNNISDLANAAAVVEVDGILQIDQNVIFGEYLNFKLTNGSYIVVKANNSLIKNGGYIGPCDYNFGGVIVENSGALFIENVRIWGAFTAIEVRENASLTSNFCVIEQCGQGIFVNGTGKIPTFQGNRISFCNVGIYAVDAYELNINSSPVNTFDNCTQGISYYKTGGIIQACRFDNCNVGISLNQSAIESEVKANFISASDVGVQINQHYPIVKIWQNSIGNNGLTPRTGISISNSQAIVESNPFINATWRGISAQNPILFVAWDNQNIIVNDNTPNDDDYSHGIYVNNLQGGIIQFNGFRGAMNNNISCTSCTNTTIANHMLSEASGHAIVIEGGTGVEVIDNKILTKPWKGIGLYSHTGGTIMNNDIRARWNGLLVNKNSTTQDIACNYFLAGVRDIETRAVLGEQYHHNNVFRTENSFALTVGLTEAEVEQSVFIVDECPTTGNTSQCDHPEKWEEDGFFNIKEFDPNYPSDYPTNCVVNIPGIRPPNSGGEGKYFGWLLNNADANQKKNPTKAWVERYKTLKLIAFDDDRRIPEDRIPDNDFYCGMDEFIAIEHSVKELIEDVNTDERFYETFQDGLSEQRRAVNNIDCSNEILALYVNIYEKVLTNMLGSTLSGRDLVEIREVAELCANKYGDVVYWARGILDYQGENRLYDDESCDNETEEPAKQKRSFDLANKEIKVSPNPAQDYINIDNNTDYDRLTIKLTDSMGRVYKINDQLEDRVQIESASFNPGIYFITLTHESGFRAVKKVVITK